MVKCIYCNSSDNISISDIIPDSITTAKCKNKNVCKECNNKVNQLHEQKFAMDFSFIRNQLGYTSRRGGRPVPFTMDIFVNKPVNSRSKPSFTKRFYDLKTFMTEELIFDDNGNVSGFKNTPKEYKNLDNPKIEYMYKVNYKNLFLSKATIRTIAKIGYEWHCKINEINEQYKRYEGIINFILNDSNNRYVEIIKNDDIDFNDCIKQSFNYVEGAHALFEYSDNGKRYVVFTLFGIVWYRIYICKEFSSSEINPEMHQFLLDKEITINKSKAIAINILDARVITKNAFIPPQTIKISSIRVHHTFDWERKLKKLCTELNITYHEVYRLIELIKKDDIFNGCNSSYFYDLLNYQEKRKIMAVAILYSLNNLIYDKDKTFIENMKVIENEINTILKDPQEFLYKNINDENSFIQFVQTLKKGKENFESIPPGS